MGRLRYHLCVLTACFALALCVGCKTVTTRAETLEAEQKIEKVQSEADEVNKAVQASSASPEVKASVAKKTQTITENAEAVKKTVESQGIVIDKLTNEIAGLKEYISELAIYKGIVWGEIGLVILALLGIGIKKIFF